MALKKQYDSKFGVTAPEAYHRISNVKGSQSDQVFYDVDIYYDEAARKANAAPLETKHMAVPLDLKSSLSVTHELYEILKEEPGYDGYAQNVFEDGDFPQVVSEITNAYIVKATPTVGYNPSLNTITAGEINGKVLLDGQIIFGNFTDLEATFVVDDGYGTIIKGVVTSGHADGYVVQVLI